MPSHTYFHEMMRGVLLLSHAMVERGDGKYYTTWNNKTKKTKKVVMKLPTGVLYWIKEPNYKSDLSAHFLEAIVGTKKMGEGKHSFYNTMRVHAQDSYKEESNNLRQNYQLETTATLKNPESLRTSDAIFFNEALDYVVNENGRINNQNRLFGQKYYTYSPPIDYDKF